MRFASQEDAQKAIEDHHGTDLEGRTLTVKVDKCGTAHLAAVAPCNACIRRSNPSVTQSNPAKRCGVWGSAVRVYPAPAAKSAMPCWVNEHRWIADVSCVTCFQVCLRQASAERPRHSTCAWKQDSWVVVHRHSIFAQPDMQVSQEVKYKPLRLANSRHIFSVFQPTKFLPRGASAPLIYFSTPHHGPDEVL